MIKLVSQFDHEESGISLATPTCGGCCCCCSCCLVSTITVSMLSARSFARAGSLGKYYPAAPAAEKEGTGYLWMYCPQCHTEYREGFDTCADCGVALVKELPKAELDKGTMKKSDRRRFFGLSLTVVSAAVALVIAAVALISLFDNGYRSALGVAIVGSIIACALGWLSSLLIRSLTQRGYKLKHIISRLWLVLVFTLVVGFAEFCIIAFVIGRAISNSV